MSVISVLHAPRDEALGRKIADALSRHGHAPRRISGDPHMGDLALADNAAIVIWSAAAAKLERLHQQARDALERGALIPVVVGGSPAPTGFEELAPVDLTGWPGDDKDPRWRFVLDEISIATQRQTLEDADVWAAPETGPYVLDDPSLEIPALEQSAEIFEAQEEGFMSPPAQPVQPAPASPARTFNVAAVALTGGGALAAAAGAAFLIAPVFVSAPEVVAPEQKIASGANEEPMPGSLAFVQPADGFTADVNDALSSAATPGDEILTAGNEFAGATVDAISNPAGSFGLGAEEMRLKPPALSEEQNQEAIDAAGLEEETTADDAEEALAEEEDASPDNDAMENLLAAIARGKEELETNGAVIETPLAETSPAEALPEDISARAYLGNFFKECADCPDMAALPAGQFRMGSPASEPARRSAEGPVTEIAISRRFAIGTREVTFAQWDACIADGGCRYLPPDQNWGRGDRPVVNVSFDDARAYAAWLSKKTGKAYRLPSEAEWEYAARAGTRGPFGIGGGLAPTSANYNAQYAYGGQKGEFRKRTTPAASFPPNDFGLFDMHGNAWEWTADCWADSHADVSKDGAPRATGDCSRRVLKGGAWNTGGWRLRSAHRIGKNRTSREFDNGFRVARDLD